MMTQEQKNDLLLKDLCARLPYGVKCSFGVDDAVYEIAGINPICCGASEIQATHIKSGINGDFTLNCCKPYLFPLSSMTEWQDRELEILMKNSIESCGMLSPYDCLEMERFFNENHLDWRGLIEKGLAIDATGLNIY